MSALGPTGRQLGIQSVALRGTEIGILRLCDRSEPEQQAGKRQGVHVGVFLCFLSESIEKLGYTAKHLQDEPYTPSKYEP